MTPTSFRLGIAAATLALLAACNGDGSTTTAPAPVSLKLSFDTAQAGWTAGAADFGLTTAPVDVETGPRALPAPAGGYGFYLAAMNRSDDVFIYAKRRFGGFVPGQRYAFGFDVSLLTAAPSGCAGVGGAPGEAVIVKAGVSADEPVTLLATGNPGQPDFMFSLDKGDQVTGGSQGVALGHIGNSLSSCGGSTVWESKRLTGTRQLRATADSTGSVWLYVGWDSGYESASAVYLQSLAVVVTPE